jgi:hypothetical protein
VEEMETEETPELKKNQKHKSVNRRIQQEEAGKDKDE